MYKLMSALLLGVVFGALCPVPTASGTCAPLTYTEVDDVTLCTNSHPDMSQDNMQNDDPSSQLLGVKLANGENIVTGSEEEEDNPQYSPQQALTIGSGNNQNFLTRGKRITQCSSATEFAVDGYNGGTKCADGTVFPYNEEECCS